MQPCISLRHRGFTSSSGGGRNGAVRSGRGPSYVTYTQIALETFLEIGVATILEVGRWGTSPRLNVVDGLPRQAIGSRSTGMVVDSGVWRAESDVYEDARVRRPGFSSRRGRSNALGVAQSAGYQHHLRRGLRRDAQGRQAVDHGEVTVLRLQDGGGMWFAGRDTGWCAWVDAGV